MSQDAPQEPGQAGYLDASGGDSKIPAAASSNRSMEEQKEATHVPTSLEPQPFAKRRRTNQSTTAMISELSPALLTAAATPIAAEAAVSSAAPDTDSLPYASMRSVPSTMVQRSGGSVSRRHLFSPKNRSDSTSASSSASFIQTRHGQLGSFSQPPVVQPPQQLTRIEHTALLRQQLLQQEREQLFQQLLQQPQHHLSLGEQEPPLMPNERLLETLLASATAAASNSNQNPSFSSLSSMRSPRLGGIHDAASASTTPTRAFPQVRHDHGQSSVASNNWTMTERSFAPPPSSLPQSLHHVLGGQAAEAGLRPHMQDLTGLETTRTAPVAPASAQEIDLLAFLLGESSQRSGSQQLPMQLSPISGDAFALQQTRAGASFNAMMDRNSTSRQSQAYQDALFAAASSTSAPSITTRGMSSSSSSLPLSWNNRSIASERASRLDSGLQWSGMDSTAAGAASVAAEAPFPLHRSASSILASSQLNQSLHSSVHSGPARPQSATTEALALQQQLGMLQRSASLPTSTINRPAAATVATASSSPQLQRSSLSSSSAMNQSMILGNPMDSVFMSEHQAYLRQQIEVFCATAEDMNATVRGRNRPIQYRQVGIRCRHCSHLPVAQRRNGSTYFPATTMGLYQAAQNLGSLHIQCGRCPEMTEEMNQRFIDLIPTKNMHSSVGRRYWSDRGKEMGLVDTDEGIFFASDVPPSSVVP